MTVSRRWKLWMILPLTLLVLGAVAFGAVAVGIQTARADSQEIRLDQLALSDFPDDIQGQFRIKLPGKGRTTVVNVKDPSHVLAARLTFQPEASLPWHTHPGPVIVVIEQGDFNVINAIDCIEREYTAGQAFVDPGHGNVHIGLTRESTLA